MTTSEERSRIMRAVRSKDTAPELKVRRLLHSMGARFRLHRQDLPGKPDIVLPGRRKAIFVHGCFWHGHDCKRGSREPKTNAPYWVEKIARNRARDGINLPALDEAGWSVLTVWECETRNELALSEKLTAFLAQGRRRL
jgi:DNA mismatch endonuclease (patch repair protein)